jgi:hypothetical protein
LVSSRLPCDWQANAGPKLINPTYVSLFYQKDYEKFDAFFGGVTWAKAMKQVEKMIYKPTNPICAEVILELADFSCIKQKSLLQSLAMRSSANDDQIAPARVGRSERFAATAHNPRRE